MNPFLTSRRDFLKNTSLACAALSFPAVLRSQSGRSLNSRLNVAMVGVGGRGHAAVNGMKGENIVAFCDVDDERATRTFSELPSVPRYRDFRRMLERHAGEIDAVTVSTPDHMHFPIAMSAIALGKHVFVEKPLTHTIAEARLLASAAREAKVATQMGNQGHANDGPRILREWLDAGLLGEVREIHSWTDRPGWPQGMGLPDHGKLMPVVPPTLDWDLWLGVAQPREYDPAYAPFRWRGYWDFGCGALGDMGCHVMDGAYWALGLGAPTSVEAIGAHPTGIGPPPASVVTYQFPARGPLPPLKWMWYDGGMLPVLPPELESARKLAVHGSLIVGSKATVLADAYYASVRVIPETRMQSLAPALPPKTLPRVAGGHFAEWIRACKGGSPAGSNFDYSSRLTETVLLGNLALRTQRRIEWDAEAMRVVNLPEANAYLTTAYRGGFGA